MHTKIKLILFLLITLITFNKSAYAGCYTQINLCTHENKDGKVLYHGLCPST